MKLVKEEFLNSEFGIGMKNCIESLDGYLAEGDEVSADQCLARWEVYQLAIKQFYGLEYYFSLTDEYFGIVTEDDTDWLMKVERKIQSESSAERR